MTKGAIWAVAIDLTKMDAKVFEYTLFMHSVVRPDKIHFVHVVKEIRNSLFIPHEYTEEFQRQLVEEKRLHLVNRVSQHFKDTDVKYECNTLVGAPMDELLDFVTNKSVELVIAGKKIDSGGAGIVSDRLASTLPCNFLIVPEDFKPRLNKILVTTDFSEHSSLALKSAMEIKRAKPSIEILVHHGYKVPMGYTKSGKTHEEFAAIMKVSAEDEMNKWLGGSQAKALLTLRDEEPLLHQIMDIVRDREIDLIIIGSKGQTVSSVALLGSHTIKLLKGNNLIPVFIVKKRGENFDLLKAVRSI